MTAHPRGGVRELEHSRRNIELEFCIILIMCVLYCMHGCCITAHALSCTAWCIIIIFWHNLYRKQCIIKRLYSWQYYCSLGYFVRRKEFI